jgi:GNAT superfamily N-acetyltransferase
MSLEESRDRFADARAALCSSGLIMPVDRDEAALRSWQNHDVASFVEHRLGIDVDPNRLDEPFRSDFIRHATDEHELTLPREGYTNPYWIRAGGETLGTVALAAPWVGSSSLSVSSLYVRREHRRQGHARRVIEGADSAAQRAGLSGIDLNTSWCWQPAVALYLSLSMWVRMWKRDLKLVLRADLPRWRVGFEGDEARFSVELGDARPATPLIVARRRGDRLDWSEHDVSPGLDELRYEAPGTFALALAVRGWPLITSDAAWQRQCEVGFSDVGGPEGLAFKIMRWEAWDRRQGYRVDTPRIPGLAYPSWKELYPEVED